MLGKLKGIVGLVKGTMQCRSLLRQINPAIVVGFGGYRTVPPVIAATQIGVPAALHEQNAVMGRANRFLAKRVGLVATGFPLQDEAFAGKLVHVGNPVRAAVVEAAGHPFPALNETGTIQLCVFGGSQGARVMSDVVPPPSPPCRRLSGRS